MDGFGIRPAMREMGQRLADGGYLVLLPDLYYRLGNYPALIPTKVLADPKLWEELMKFVASLDRERKNFRRLYQIFVVPPRSQV
jgi:carboxymethylenebutenolidase